MAASELNGGGSGDAAPVGANPDTEAPAQRADLAKRSHEQMVVAVDSWEPVRLIAPSGEEVTVPAPLADRFRANDYRDA